MVTRMIYWNLNWMNIIVEGRWQEHATWTCAEKKMFWNMSWWLVPLVDSLVRTYTVKTFIEPVTIPAPCVKTNNIWLSSHKNILIIHLLKYKMICTYVLSGSLIFSISGSIWEHSSYKHKYEVLIYVVKL